jgi:hypothetical protein
MRSHASRGAGTFVLLALCACGSGDPPSPQAVTEATTAAVYNDDLNALQAHFDDALRKQVTIDGAASLSQKLHAFGAYTGLTSIASDAGARRYAYSANFEGAAMTVHVRLDADGRIAAYRIDVPQNVAARK